jgi:hypothetical protein
LETVRNNLRHNGGPHSQNIQSNKFKLVFFVSVTKIPDTNNLKGTIIYFGSSLQRVKSIMAEQNSSHYGSQESEKRAYAKGPWQDIGPGYTLSDQFLSPTFYDFPILLSYYETIKE